MFRKCSWRISLLFFMMVLGDEYMKYQVQTPHGIFEVFQSLTYGEMLIAGILVVIAVILGFKVLYDVLDREGFI